MRNKLLADFYQQLNPDNSMTFNRLLAHSLGAVETIILFTLIGKYYYYADKEMIDENGWFYVTVPDLHESTSFGEKIQRNAIKHLESMGFIQTSVKGIPPKRYFKVNNDMELLEKYLVKGKEISDGIKLKAAEDNAKKVAAANAKRRKKNKTIPADSQFLPNGGIDSSQMAESTYKTKSNKTKSNINQSINQDNINNININTYRCDDLDSIDEIDIKNRIGYEKLKNEFDEKQLDNIVGLMTETFKSEKERIRIAGENLEAQRVKERFAALTDNHIRYVLECIQNQSGNGIRNIRQYLLTSLYNAPVTMESYYAARERPDKPDRESEAEHSYDLNEMKMFVNNFPDISP